MAISQLCRILLGCALVTTWSTAHALTPPLEEAELRHAATVVAEGEVGGPLQCLGEIDTTACGPKFKYMAPFTIRKILHGKAIRTTGTIYFYHVFYKDGCTGDQDATHYPGERGVYYLRQVEGGGWHQVHWSGVTVTHEGHGTLPACPH
ncbi:MAG: hypothetical protein HY696_11840 [Deltaproteobacteria bacterium]|nr:hypothetical protein [Deltaproteobacteria bacterium]